MSEKPKARDLDRLLGFPARRLMLQIIEDDPGIFVGDLQALLTLDTGGFYYHLKMLREAGVVEERRVHVGGTVRKALYPAGRGPPPGREDDPLFAEASRRVAERLLAGKGLSSAEIVAQTGLPERTVRRHLSRLVEAGLATDKREGRNISYYSTGELSAAWNAHP